MSFRIKDSNYAEKLKTFADSETIFISHIEHSVDTGGLEVGKGKDITDRQLEELEKYDGPVAFRLQPVVTVSDAAKTAGKPVMMLTSSIAGSPIRAVIKASQEEYKLRFAMATAAQIADFYGFPGLYGYMVTLTIPNVSVSRLKSTIDELLDRGAKCERGMYDAARRGTGLTLPALDGADDAISLGGMMKLEITVNLEKLRAKDKSGIFHPHLHMIILTSKPLDVFAAQLKFYDYWVKRNPDKKLSPKAFKLEPCYSHSTAKVGGPEALQSAVVEASKYVIKPDFYKNFPKIANDFSTAVFCALFKATKRRQALRSYGILQKARSYMTWLKGQSSELYEAALIAGYEGSVDNPADIHVPDIYSHLTVVKNGNVVEDRELNNEELLGANRSLLEGAILAGAKEGLAKTKWPANETALMRRHLLNKTDFIEDRSSFVDRLNVWTKGRDAQISRLYAQLQAETDNKKHEELSSKLWTVSMQQSDLQALKAALPLDWCNVKYTKLNNLGKKRALFERIKELKGRVVMPKPNQPEIIFDSDPQNSDEIEQRLCAIYLSTPLQDVRFLPFYVIAQYRTWLKTGNISPDREDRDSFSIIHEFDVDSFQRSVDKLKTKRDKSFKLIPKYKKMFV